MPRRRANGTVISAARPAPLYRERLPHVPFAMSRANSRNLLLPCLRTYIAGQQLAEGKCSSVIMPREQAN